MNKLKVLLILGSIRVGRQSEKVALAMKGLLEERDLEVNFLDLKELDLPMFNASDENQNLENVQRLLSSFKDCDGVIIVSPEYNHGLTSALKNAIDYAMKKELYNKPMATVGVSSGGFGGMRLLKALQGVWLGVGGISLPKYLATPNVEDFNENELAEKWLGQAEQFLDINLELFEKLK